MSSKETKDKLTQQHIGATLKNLRLADQEENVQHASSSALLAPATIKNKPHVPDVKQEFQPVPALVRQKADEAKLASSQKDGPLDKPPKKEKGSFKDFMSKKRQDKKENQKTKDVQFEEVEDPYKISQSSKNLVKHQTALIYEMEVQQHFCKWDPLYPECPTRLQAIIDTVISEGWLDRCRRLPNADHPDLRERIVAFHTDTHFESLKTICQAPTLKELEEHASQYDAIYFNQSTFRAACLAVSCTLTLAYAVAKGEVQNGMALVRPPGHHASSDEFNGYCFFNNVGIAAEACIAKGLAKKILIVDVDVHHGQGTQRFFYNRKDVLYFSIHRYEHGAFWPNLLESNFNYIGAAEGLGYNINVPLNKVGLNDSDYIAIVISLLLPIAYEFDPDLILVSAGYDLLVGDTEGQMNVTPGFFAHLMTMLHGLARGKIVAVLEGGYFAPVMAMGVAMTIRGLLGEPCPLLDPIKHVDSVVVETIANIRRTLQGHWNCLKLSEFHTGPSGEDPEDHRFEIWYKGQPLVKPFETRDCYPFHGDDDLKKFEKIATRLGEKYKSTPISLPVCYVYDEGMLAHAPPAGDKERVERPERLKAIMEMFDEFDLPSRMTRLSIELRNIMEYSPHSVEYLQSIGPAMPQHNDVFCNEHTNASVALAVSGVMAVADAIMLGQAKSGVAVIRPPGHHAELDHASGFCIVNNVAHLAIYLQRRYSVTNTLIVDIDIHHGNGTQKIFYNTDHVMYMSIHKDEQGRYFPLNSDRSYVFDGTAEGKGYNINVPFNKDKMGDTEYMATFLNVVMPIAYSYRPDVVIVSAGFDAGFGDPLGNYSVMPETFGHMINLLKGLAQGRLILVLEGGYNLQTTALSLTMCTKALLGDPLPMPRDVFQRCSYEALKSMRAVIEEMGQYFRVFAVYKKLILTPTLIRSVVQKGREVVRKMTLNPNKFTDNDYVEEIIANMEKGEI